MACSASASSILDWTEKDVVAWLGRIGLEKYGNLFLTHSIDGCALLFMTEDDLRNTPLEIKCLGDIKKMYHAIHILQLDNIPLLIKLGYDPCNIIGNIPQGYRHEMSHYYCQMDHPTSDVYPLELWKTLISLLYLFIVTWITAFVMVIVHNRVPDMKKYPPLPDIFLDNVPHIPWAFAMCEFTGTLMLIIWIAVLIFHKHRFILLRRFFALSGTVFLLRCVTMLITSLSVPGTHLQCNPMVEELQLDNGSYHSVWVKARQAYFIWRGAGMSIQGVRTCGDYMFSGHTAALTILNFFITEYTPRHLYFMHTFSWILNMFGIFFILSAHEHYSIDVFIAFYITSRLFLYYHTLANNQALMQRDSSRTRIWFPLFSFFESEVDGIVPNEYETPATLAQHLFRWFKDYWKNWYRLSMRRDIVPEEETRVFASEEHSRRHIKYKRKKES
ncbi:UNVERIFIED_CONTAM: hypothetical protein PYX00_008923 [Menopon gallinae]|uniref:SAM domain-containing protein n=1 Tax=Menopon gallinae TaxID=328185 RepID=A0AAW2H9H8_9NEOP